MDDIEHEDGLESEPHECPLCGGPAASMGTLGRREHFRCRDCGAEFSQVAEPSV